MTTTRVTPKAGAPSPRSASSAAVSPKRRDLWHPYRWNIGELLTTTARLSLARGRTLGVGNLLVEGQSVHEGR